MFSYENGLMVAFILWLVCILNAAIMLNSQMEKNLNKIGMCLSWWNLGMTQKNYSDDNRSTLTKVFIFLLLWVILPLPFIALSWLYVAAVIANFLFYRYKDFGAPRDIKEFRWKLKNIDLSFDQIVKDLMKTRGDDPSEFENIKAELLRDINLRKNPLLEEV